MAAFCAERTVHDLEKIKTIGDEMAEAFGVAGHV
jgi:hypothetical protein